jgi:acyl-CoA synthetase (AMP-forming)/AMP-acid ligase II
VSGLLRCWQRNGTWKRISTQLQAQADADGLITWDVSNVGEEARLRKEVAGRVFEAVEARPVAVVVLSPGTLPKTPSGKLRRSAAGQQLAESIRRTESS